MDVLKRIDEIMRKQHLNDYQLSKLSGLSTSTISNMRKRNTIPSIATPEVIADKRKIYKGVSANVDFYSGFVYSMLDIPLELYTPIFAMARIVGWSAHHIEELVNADKIIRPAYKSIMVERDYVPMDER